MTRGQVIPLTALERRDRMLYLAGELELNRLTHLDTGRVTILSGYSDVHGQLITPVKCPAIYYRLQDFNGGSDPYNPDCASRWRVGTQENRTSDCIGGQSWAGGWDRFQPKRFPLYGGWINTNSMRMDVRGKSTCFTRLERPELGCYVVYESDPMGKTHGVKVGHIAGVVGVPAEWDPTKVECWEALGVVDVAARVGRANKRTTGKHWFKKDAYFIVPNMF